MKFSYNWIKSLVPDLDASPEELANKLTLFSFETEVISAITIDPKIITAKIEKINPHPDANKLQLAEISTGQENLTVVCGANNLVIGGIVAYAPPGSRVLDEEGNKFKIRKAKIRGVESPGMLASPRELGLSPDHDGILLLPADTSIGEPLVKHFSEDTVLEIDMTPNRAHDCLSHIGIGREVAAIYDLSITEPDLVPLPNGSTKKNELIIQIESSTNANRYLGAIIENIKVKPSPLWMQARIIAAGGKPINNIVDISNYVMFEYGNPTHIFDLTKLSSTSISVRHGKEKDKLEALNGETYSLTEMDVVITADGKPVALAGVIGGQNSSISEDSVAGLLEVANFNAFKVQETASRHNIRTESSNRFSKNIDSSLVAQASQRALQLLIEHAEASVKIIKDVYPKPRKANIIDFNPSRPEAIAGTNISPEISKKALLAVGCTVEENDSAPWSVTPPSYRLDLEGEHDLVEEVIRLNGLDKINMAKLAEFKPQPINERIHQREIIRETLFELGFTETYNSAFESEDYAPLTGANTKKHLSLQNPPTPEQERLRVSLLPGLISNLVKNREELHRIGITKESALFEIGRVYEPGEGGEVAGVIENELVSGVIVGTSISLQQVAKALSESLGIEGLDISNAFSESVQEKIKFRQPLLAFEINLTSLIEKTELESPPARALSDLVDQNQNKIHFTAINKYPAAYRDLSIIVRPDISIEDIQEVIGRVGGKMIADVGLFDEYQPDAENKSLAFHIKYQADDRTLIDQEVNNLHNNIVTTLQSELSAEVR